MIELYATVAAQIVAFVVWIARIEMRLRFVEKDHAACQATRVAAESATVKKLEEMNQRLAEVSTDIKWLINKNGGRHVEAS